MGQREGPGRRGPGFVGMKSQLAVSKILSTALVIGLAGGCIRLNPKASAAPEQASGTAVAPLTATEAGQGRLVIGGERRAELTSASLDLQPGGRALVTFHEKEAPFTFIGTWSADPKDPRAVTLQITGGFGNVSARGQVVLRAPEAGFYTVGFEGGSQAKPVTATFTSGAASPSGAVPTTPGKAGGATSRQVPIRELSSLETGSGQMNVGGRQATLGRAHVALKRDGDVEIVLYAGHVPTRLTGVWARNTKDPLDIPLKITGGFSSANVAGRGTVRLAGGSFQSVSADGSVGPDRFSVQFTSERPAAP